MVRATSVLGGTYTPHCAAVDPARLVRGLAEAVERRGVAVYEQTEVRAIRPGAVETPGARCGRPPWCGPPRATPAPCGARSAPSSRCTR
jgi:hypothetical protein